MILLQMIAIGAFGLLMIYKPWQEPAAGDAARGRAGEIEPVSEAGAQTADPRIRLSA